MANGKQRTSLQVDLGKKRLNEWFAAYMTAQTGNSEVETSGTTAVNTTSTEANTTGTQTNGTSGNVTETDTATETAKLKEYRVVKGDSLKSIADRFEITIAEIADLPENQWYFQLVTVESGILTPNTVLMLPAKAKGVPDLANPVYENEPGDITPSETEEVKPLLEVPVSGKRTDIKIWTPLTAKQKEDYKWTEVKEKFLETNADVKSPNELDAWIRKNLRDGWSGGKEAAPSLMKTRVLEKKDGDKGPVFEAYSFSAAWKGAVDYPLQKNVGAYFYWQHKLSDKRGLYQLEYSSNEQWLNFQNNKDLPSPPDYVLLASVAGEPADQDLLAALQNIKSPNDQLLSKEFMLLTNHAQTKMYKGPDAAAKITGIFTADTAKDILSFDKKRTDDTNAANAEHDKLLKGGVPDKNNPINYRYIRNGSEIVVDHGKLIGFEYVCIQNASQDGLESYVTDNFPPGNVKSVRYFSLLSHKARTNLLAAYNAEWWLTEEQEKIVNQIIQSTPYEADPTDPKNVPNQQIALDTWLHATNAGKTSVYSELKENINDTSETKRTFFDVTENIAPVVAGKPKVDTEFINEILADADDQTKRAGLAEKVDTMSQNQILSLTKEQVSKIFGACRNQYYTDFVKHKGMDHLLSVWGPKNAAMMAFLLTWDQLEWMDSLFHMLEDTDFEALRDDLFEKTLAGNADVLDLITKISASTAVAKRDWEVVAAVTPNSVYKYAGKSVQFNIISMLTNSAHADDSDEKTIIRIMNAVGTQYDADKTLNEADRKIKKDEERQEMYNMITQTWDPGLDKLMSAFQGRNETVMVQAVNSLNTNSAANDYQSERDKVTNAAPGEKDDVIDTLAPEVIASLNIAERIEYIKIILGRTDIEEKFKGKIFELTGFTPEGLTRVGRDDEESLLLLINTCKKEDISTMLYFLQNNNGDFYASLQAAIDGEQFKKLHENMALAADEYTGQEMIPDPNNPGGPMIKNPDYMSEQDKNKLKSDMTEQELNHPAVIPWQDPGMLRQIFGANSKQYGARWTANDEITVTYVDTNIWATSSLVGNIADQFKDHHEKKFKPWQLMGVYFLRDDSDLGATKGEIKFMPAAYIFFLKNKQFHQQLNEAIEVAALALGAWELTAALAAAEVSFSALAMAIIDVALPAGSLFMSSYKENLPPEVREAWEDLNTVIMAYQFIHGGVEAYKTIRTKIDKLLKAAAKLGAEDQAVIKNAALQAEGEVRFAEEIDNATIDDLRSLTAELDKKEIKFTLEEEKNIRLKIEERNAILTNDEKLLNKVKAEQDAIKNANKVEPVSVNAKPGEILTPSKNSTKETFITYSRNEKGELVAHFRTVEKGKDDVLCEMIAEVNANGEVEFRAAKVGEEIPEDFQVYTKDEWIKAKTAENMNKEEQLLLKDKPGAKPKTTPVKVNEPDPVMPKENGEVPEMLAYAKAKNVVTVSGKDAERMMEELGVNAMYVPGPGGRPGILVVGPNASKADVFEEMLHMKQHEALGWKKMTKEEIIQGEIDAQTEMIQYAKDNKLPAEKIDEYEQTKKIWEEQKNRLAKGEVLADMPDVFFSLMKKSTAERKATMVFKKGMSEKEFLDAAKKSMKNANYGVFEADLKKLYNDLNTWPEGQVNDIQSYFNAHPESDLSAYDLKAEINEGKTFDAATGEFSMPGSKKANIKAQKQAYEPPKIDESTLTPEKRLELKQRKAANDAIIKKNDEILKKNAADRQKYLDEADHASDNTVREDFLSQARELSYESGETAADTYMRSIGGKRLFPAEGEAFSSASREVDQIWEVNGKLFVVEAKGGVSELGTKLITEGDFAGQIAQQGTKPYLEQTLNEMIDAGGAGAIEAQKALIALKAKTLKYLEVRQSFDKFGVAKPIQVNEFNIY
jgi:hypothetical protein